MSPVDNLTPCQLKYTTSCPWHHVSGEWMSSQVMDKLKTCKDQKYFISQTLGNVQHTCMFTSRHRICILSPRTLYLCQTTGWGSVLIVSAYLSQFHMRGFVHVSQQPISMVHRPRFLTFPVGRLNVGSVLLSCRESVAIHRWTWAVSGRFNKQQIPMWHCIVQLY